jgi:hypothetical protein
VQGFFCLFYVRWGWENKKGKKNFAQLGKNKCLVRWEKTTNAVGSVGWVGRKYDSDSVPILFLIIFVLIRKKSH